MEKNKGIDLNVLPSDGESSLNKDKKNDFDLNIDINCWGESSSQATGNVHGNGDQAFDLNTSPLHEETGDQEIHNLNARNRGVKKMLSNAQHRAVYEALLARSVDEKFKKRTKRVVASLFSISLDTFQRIWKQGHNIFTESEAYVSHKKTKNCGRKRIQIDHERIRETPFHKRSTFRTMASGTKYKKSSLHRSTLPNDPMFIDMYNIVHIDEKWFFMTRASEKYILLPNEVENVRTSKSKNFIIKVIFLTATARPRFDSQGVELFSRKIGIFTFVTKEPAKRSSANREAGMLETKSMNSVKRNMMRIFFIEKILPAIRAKWPREDARHPIFIQQDNAKTHIEPDEEEFCRAASQDGFDIRLMFQPPNSPDMNVLDLGFFRVIQSLQYQMPSTTIDELIDSVERSFKTFPTKKSNYIFLSLQQCMIEVMKVQGCNSYPLPHMKKEALEREGRLPIWLNCDPQIV